jgi:predicted small lipoprotein YifL
MKRFFAMCVIVSLFMSLVGCDKKPDAKKADAPDAAPATPADK